MVYNMMTQEMVWHASDDEFAALFPVSTRKKEGNGTVICPGFLMTP